VVSRQIRIWSLAFIVVIVAAGGFFWMRYLRVPTNVAYVTEEDGALSVVNLSTLQVERRIHFGKLAPRGLAVTVDGKYLVTANKNTADLAVFGTPRLRLLSRIHIGSNPEFLKMAPGGGRLFATFEPGSSGGPPKSLGGKEEDDDADEPPAQIAAFHVGDWAPGPVVTAGKETEGVEFSRDGKRMLVANEAQNTIGIYDPVTSAHLRDVTVKPYGIRPRGIKASPTGAGYAVTMEASGTLLRLDQDLNVIKTAATAEKPYGLAFDRAGKRIFVSAAAARKLQVFAADSLQLLAEVPTGQRCWHFTFTPDDSKILLACGRSNNLVVVDANSYRQIGTIEGFKLPWGIVTYPASFGSLGLP
jgi:DNA-binding beta-propeller fold protein YncE